MVAFPTLLFSPMFTGFPLQIVGEAKVVASEGIGLTVTVAVAMGLEQLAPLEYTTE